MIKEINAWFNRHPILTILAIVLILVIGLFYPDDSNQEISNFNLGIIEKSLIKETSHEREGICDKYKLDTDKVTLWCTEDLTEFGQHAVMGRIYKETEGKLNGKVKYDQIIFKGWDSNKILNIFYEYTFQE